MRADRKDRALNVASGGAKPAPLGWALGIVILAAVFAAHGSAGSPLGFADGFAAARVAAAAMSLLGAVAGMFAPGRRKVPKLPASTLSRSAQPEEELGVS